MSSFTETLSNENEPSITICKTRLLQKDLPKCFNSLFKFQLGF